MRLGPVLLILLALPACSSKTGEVQGKKFATVETFCSEWAELVCTDDMVERCSSASVDACRTKQGAF